MRVVYVNVYELTQHYGGPEEGGWWFDSGEPVRSIPCRPRDAERCLRRVRAVLERADDGRPRWQSNGTPDLAAWVDDHPAKPFPEDRPFYE